jgi:hypothetical protein
MARITGNTKKIAVGLLFVLVLAIIAIMNIKNIKDIIIITQQRQFDPSSSSSIDTNINDSSVSVSLPVSDSDSDSDSDPDLDLDLESDADSSYDNTMCKHLNESLPQHISELYQHNIDFFKKNGRKKKNNSPSSGSSESLFKSVLIDGIHHHHHHHHQSSLSLSSSLSSQDKTDGLDLTNALTLPFRGKKLVFIGDSTVHHLFFALKTLMMTTNNSNNNDNDILSLQNRIEEELRKGKRTYTGSVTSVVDDVNKVDMYYLKVSEINGTVTDTIFQYINNEMDGADLVVFNVGLHLFHLIGPTNVHNMLPAAYQAWINYELMIKDFIKLSIKKKPKIILIKTTNIVCDGKFMNAWSDLSKKYNNNDKETINYCIDHVSKATNISTTNNKTVITTNQISKLCQFGAMTSKGSIFLNERMKNVINDIQINDDEFISSNITLGIYNDHDLQSCELSRKGDGRHYKKTLLSRINLLAIMLNCLS